jgi:hypothetical protein
MATPTAEFNDSTPEGKVNTDTGFPDVSMLDSTCNKKKAQKTAGQLEKAGFKVGVKVTTPEYKNEKARYQVVYW